MDNWYTIHNIEKVDTPAFVIFPERVTENINILKRFVPDIERLRPHVKTHKSGNITRMLLDAGIGKFKCATIAEAEMLAREGAPDVLLAYQPVGPKASRLMKLVDQYPGTTFSCLIDNIPSARQLDMLAQAINHCLPVYVDVNVGMNRTGIQPGEEALTLFMESQNMKGLLPVGLHVYDGHIRDADFSIRTKRCDEAFAQVEALILQLQKKGVDDLVIVAGGSPTFSIHSKRDDVECSPGTFIFWDKGYHDILAEQPFVYAALVVTRVISVPGNDTICVDLGHKSIASENSLNNRVYFLNAPALEPVSHSEEHLVLRSHRANTFTVGDVLYGVPFHVCPTCALYDTATVVTGHHITDQWMIESRSRKISI